MSDKAFERSLVAWIGVSTTLLYFWGKDYMSQV